MKNVIIFGAAAKGLQLKRYLEQSKAYKVCCFCDNNPKKWKETLDGLSIISIDDAEAFSQDGFQGIFILAVNHPEQIVEQIQNKGRFSLPVYGVLWECIQQNFKDQVMSETALYMIDVSKPYLDYFEYHVSDHCNLKCRGCGHYSNIAKPQFGDLESYRRDIRRLKELFWGVKKIRLMGGEPLLNRKLPEFISDTRSIFPDADIMVVTNGLLIPEADDKLLKTMHKKFVRFDISLYPPTNEIKEKIELKCIEHGVNFCFSDLIEQFFDNINYRGDSNQEDAFARCGSNHCHFLEKGKISVCGLPILYKKLQDRLDWDVQIEDRDIIDLYDKDLDGRKLNDLLSKPMPACRYCSDNKAKMFQWQGNYPYFDKINE